METIQRVEVNCGRVEARAIEVFGTTSEAICFPYASQAAMLMQRTDQSADPKGNGTVFLLSSRSDLGAKEMLQLKRNYWDIENGAHQRLDCSRFQEDKSRVRNRNSATNLGLFRRAVLSLARHWISQQKDPRKATTNGFFGAMKKNNSGLAFRVTLAKKPTWRP